MTRREKSWKPIRRGARYCSPACGFNCTWEQYQLVKTQATSLAAGMGRGWKTKVWENTRWHYCVISPCGRIKLHPYHDLDGKTTGCTAFLGEPGSGGGPWAEHGRTPQTAMRKVIREAKVELARIGATLQGFTLI